MMVGDEWKAQRDQNQTLLNVVGSYQDQMLVPLLMIWEKDANVPTVTN